MVCCFRAHRKATDGLLFRDLGKWLERQTMDSVRWSGFVKCNYGWVICAEIVEVL